jgi:hypothetical protein
MLNLFSKNNIIILKGKIYYFDAGVFIQNYVDANIKGFGRYSHTIFDAILQILRSLKDIIMFLPYTVLNS